MEASINSMLLLGAISSMRHDDAVARQGVMNHQTATHLMDLSFIRDSVEMSIPEAFAVGNMALPAHAAGLNAGTQTPKSGN